MENGQWVAECQQSGAGTDTTQDCLNNGGKDNNAINTIEGAQDPDRLESDNPIISEKAKQLISVILDQMKELSNPEKYFLYLKLFQVSNVIDPLRQPLNPLGSRSEINRTISWIKTHLEEDPETSLPKQHVYEEYSNYCVLNQIKSLSQADFGKVMKQVYPKVRARRLGTRGNSRYCYSGLRRCIKLKPPKLPDLSDKPLSTEAPCTLSSLTAAAWLIVKEWSEFHFSTQFASLQALAKFLVVNHSVGAGTDAAQQLTLATESQIKGEPLSANNGTKHREMQLQLQKKIQQKNEMKERKRKVPLKNEQKSVGKKPKPALVSRPEMSPTLTSESSTNTSTGSTSTSPTQGKLICDKSLDFTELPTLPDFKSFQRPVSEQPQSSPGVTPKVAIPRLSISIKNQHQRSPQLSPKKQVKSAKYKNIQPKPQPCDIASYNPQNSADIRSQIVQHNVDRVKELKNSDDDTDAPTFPLPRERLHSISNVSKDAMDEYLGTNNSQHEEELSKYFNDNMERGDQDHTTKLFKLRQLLEQNGIADNKNNVITNYNATPLTNSAEEVLQGPNVVPYSIRNPINSNIGFNNSSNARRRVSFETPTQDDSIPPSPNTRCKNFSFTPISPGPHSPNGRHSKCSSTNVSPFVSPRNTPVPRVNKNAALQNVIMRKKIKKEQDLTLEIPDDGKKCAMVMSAPASPMLMSTNKSVLQKLLKSNSKVAYNPDYMNNCPSKRDLSSEISNLFEENGNDINLSELTYRSQSVPIGQMIKSNFSEDTNFLPVLSGQNTTVNDFNDFEDAVTETVTVNRIIDALDEQRCEDNCNNMFNMTVTTSNQCLPGFNQIVNNNVGIQPHFEDINTYTPCTRNLNRSQSIDFNYCYENKCSNNPSRSVPSTPLSFNQIKTQALKNCSQSSRSYPSTPLIANEDSFNYPINGDCLLNGQPIRNNGVSNSISDNLTCFIENLNGINDGNIIDRDLTNEDEFRNLPSNDFGIVVENENSVMDSNGVLINEQNYNGNIPH